MAACWSSFSNAERLMMVHTRVESSSKVVFGLWRTNFASASPSVESERRELLRAINALMLRC